MTNLIRPCFYSISQLHEPKQISVTIFCVSYYKFGKYQQMAYIDTPSNSITSPLKSVRNHCKDKDRILLT